MKGFEKSVIESLYEIKVDQKESNRRLDRIEVDVDKHITRSTILEKHVDNYVTFTKWVLPLLITIIGIAVTVVLYNKQ